MVAISIAQYSHKRNAVAERRLREYPFVDKAFYDDFALWAGNGHAIYGFYSDNYNVQTIAESNYYKAEYQKVID